MSRIPNLSSITVRKKTTIQDENTLPKYSKLENLTKNNTILNKNMTKKTRIPLNTINSNQFYNKRKSSKNVDRFENFKKIGSSSKSVESSSQQSQPSQDASEPTKIKSVSENIKKFNQQAELHKNKQRVFLNSRKPVRLEKEVKVNFDLDLEVPEDNEDHEQEQVEAKLEPEKSAKSQPINIPINIINSKSSNSTIPKNILEITKNPVKTDKQHQIEVEKLKKLPSRFPKMFYEVENLGKLPDDVENADLKYMAIDGVSGCIFGGWCDF